MILLGKLSFSQHSFFMIILGVMTMMFFENRFRLLFKHPQHFHFILVIHLDSLSAALEANPLVSIFVLLDNDLILRIVAALRHDSLTMVSLRSPYRLNSFCPSRALPE